MEKIEDIKSPFMCYCAKVIPLAFDESMSYYECLCNFYNYLKNEVMPAINNNADATKELQDLFIQLENYVNTYFDNLDIQTEINNKLDEMYEDGKLSSLLTEYLQLKTTYTFDTVAEMKLATNFINGCYAKTLGYNELNDGGTSYYKIRTKTNDDTADEIFLISLYDETLIAELLINKELNVRQAGLTGDSEDDATDILTSLCASDYDLYLPSGTYCIDTSITLTHNIRGDGADKSIIKLVGETNNELFNSYYLTNLEIKDLCFDCGELTDRTKTSVNLYYTNGLKILNCEFKNGYGGHLRLNDSENVLIENCNFHDISGEEGNMGNAIYCHPVRDLLINNCKCNNIMEDFLYLDGADDNSPVKNVIVSNCYLKNTSHNNAITVSNCIGINGCCFNVTVKSCYLENNGAGIRCQARYGYTPTDIFIFDNKISDNIQNGINITANNCFINNNVIYNCPQDCVYITGASNVTLTNNIVHNAGRNGIWCRGSHYLTIDNNRIYNNYTCGLALGTTSDYNCDHVNISNCEVYQNNDGTQLTGIQYLYGDDIKILSCHAYNNTIDYDINRTGTTNMVSQLNPIRTKSISKSIMYSNEIIGSGTYNVGDIILYTNPVANGHIGAVCVTAGTPGTWREFGKIENS